MTKMESPSGLTPKTQPGIIKVAIKVAPPFVRSTYIIALLLLLSWVVGFLVFHAGNGIHVLLLLSMTAILTNIVREG